MHEYNMPVFLFLLVRGICSCFGIGNPVDFGGLRFVYRSAHSKQNTDRLSCCRAKTGARVLVDCEQYNGRTHSMEKSSFCNRGWRRLFFSVKKYARNAAARRSPTKKKIKRRRTFRGSWRNKNRPIRGAGCTPFFFHRWPPPLR